MFLRDPQCGSVAHLCVANRSEGSTAMKSVPPRGSGWVCGIDDYRLSNADWLSDPRNYRSKVGNLAKRPTRYREVVLTSSLAGCVDDSEAKAYDLLKLTKH